MRPLRLLARRLRSPGFWLGLLLAAAWGWHVFGADRPVVSWPVAENAGNWQVSRDGRLAVGFDVTLPHSPRLTLRGATRCYDLETGRALWESHGFGHHFSYPSVAFSDDSRWVYTQMADGDRYRFQVLDAASGATLGEWNSGRSSGAMLNSWPLTAGPGGDSIFVLRDPATPRKLRVLRLPDCHVLATLPEVYAPYAIHPDGRSVAGVDGSSCVAEMSLTGDVVRRFAGAPAHVTRLAWDETGSRLAARWQDRDKGPLWLAVWDRDRPEQPARVWSVPGRTTRSWGIRFLDSDHVTLVGNSYVAGSVWDLRPDPPVPVRNWPNLSARAPGTWLAQTDPEQGRYLVPTEGNAAWDLHVHHDETTWKRHPSTDRFDDAPLWSPDTRHILTCEEGGRQSEWQRGINRWSLSWTGRELFARERSTRFHITDATTGRSDGTIRTPGGFYAVAVDPRRGLLWTAETARTSPALTAWRLPSPWPRRFLALLTIACAGWLVRRRVLAALHPGPKFAPQGGPP